MNTMDLCRATITVQYVNQPKPPRKSGTIKDVDGQMFGVWPTQLSIFQPGETYDIEYTEKDVNGTTFRDIKNAKPAPAPQRPQNPPPSSQHPKPSGGQQNGSGYYRPTAPRDSKRMFICSQLNALISSRQITLSSDGFIEAIGMLSHAYDQTIGLED